MSLDSFRPCSNIGGFGKIDEFDTGYWIRFSMPSITSIAQSVIKKISQLSNGHPPKLTDRKGKEDVERPVVALEELQRSKAKM